MDFVLTGEEALWSRERQVLAAIRRNGFEISTGVERDGNEEWLPIVNALPEDRIEGHTALLGREQYELDADYDANVVLRTFPEADFSPETFLKYAQQRTRNAANIALSVSDWMVIRQTEINTPVPAVVTEARQAVRDSVDVSLARLAGLTPSQYLDFAPTEVHEATRAHHAAVESVQ
jgi:hypothetical protein